jgi:hypothetical protein
MSIPCIARCVSVLALFTATAAWGAGASIPNPESDLDAELSAKLLKAKASQTVRSNAVKNDPAATAADSSNCGNVNINSNNQAQNNNSGIKNMFGKESVTIVTGPVINAANCR